MVVLAQGKICAKNKPRDVAVGGGCVETPEENSGVAVA
jgi:hypothetical protein